MRFLTRGRVATLVIVVAFLAVNAIALRWSAHFFSFKRDLKLLRYGDRLPKLKGKTLTGGQSIEIAAKSPTTLILYFSSPKPPGFSTELVKYAEVLSQRYKKDGLGIAVVVPQEITELKTLVEHKLVTYDTIVDNDGKIQAQLGLQTGEDGVFVFNQEGLCRFSTRRPVSANDLSQLVALEALKVDPFAMPAEAETILTDSKSLGSFSLLELQSLEPAKMDEIRSKAGVPTHYVFFTADCSICSLPTYLEEFRVFRSKQLKSDDDAVLIFDYNFSRTDVLDELKKNNLQIVSYLAKEPLPKLQYSDHEHSILERTVAVIETDDQRTIREIYPLNFEQRGPTVITVNAQASAYTAGATYEEMFKHVSLTAYDVATYQGKYYLTDFGGNRLLVIKDNMVVERNFARIGSGPGRLFHPGYLDIGRDGTIFVEDGGNERIVKFSPMGNYLGAFSVPEFQGFAVGAQNEIYLGQPEAGHLITVYSGEGKKLRSFGELKEFPEIYGEASAAEDAPYKIAYNRVRLATDKDGNLYVSYMLMPLIQKYSPDGTLIFERRLEAPEIDLLMEAIHKTRYISTKSDGVDARIIALDPVIDPANGNIMVPLVDGSIYVTDRESNKLSLLRPKFMDRDNGTFHPFIAGLGANGELMTTAFPPKHWYRLAVDNDKNSKSAATALSGKDSTVAAR
jgi:peroxiredoxin